MTGTSRSGQKFLPPGTANREDQKDGPNSDINKSTDRAGTSWIVIDQIGSFP